MSRSDGERPIPNTITTRGAGTMTTEMVLAGAAFVGMFVMWVVVPSFITRYKGQNKD